MTFRQLLKTIFEHMAKLGMLDDLENKYSEENEDDETIRSEIGGAQ